MDIIKSLSFEYLNSVDNESETSKILKELDILERELIENVSEEQKENVKKISLLIDKLIFLQSEEVADFILSYFTNLLRDLAGNMGENG